MQTAPGAASATAARHGDDLADGAPPIDRSDADGGRSLEDRRRSRLVLLLLFALLAVPLVTAVVAIGEPRWYPTVDDAQTELRVRDVGTADPPLTGLGGRIGEFGPDSGSHPGPLSFWALAGPYRLFGASSWALQAATASLHIVAMGLTLWLARRRGGVAALLGVAVALVALAQAYGAYALTLPWNPYLPVLWWLVFVLGVWSLLCGDLPVLPVTVFAGSFCAQTHISYVGLVAALVGLGTVAVAYWLYVRRRDEPERRRGARWAVLGAAVGAVLWFPPVAEQVTGSQDGNFGKILRHFGTPPEESLGVGMGLDLVLANLNPWHLFTEPVIAGRPFLGGPTLPGTLLLVAWAMAIVVTWRLRHRTLLRLHGLLAVVLALGVLSASRIFGPPWAYLALWAWGICAMLVVAVAWSACALVAAVVPDETRRRLATAGAVGAIAVVVALAARFTVDATDVQHPQPELSASSGELVPQTIEALEGGEIPGGSRDGRYLVTWEDPQYLGSRGFSLFNELDREGFDIGAPRFLRSGVTRHRVLAPEDATARIHLATGADIGSWQARPDFREIASWDPSGPEGRAEYERLLADVTAELEAAGRPDLANVVRENPRGLGFEQGLSQELVGRVGRMIELGSPVAVFVGPPSTAG